MKYLKITTLITTIAMLGGLIACDTSVDNIPVSESKIVQVSELPPDSLLVPADDFELITEDLPDYLKTSNNSGKNSFNPWIPDNYRGGEKLTLLWELDNFREPIVGGYEYKKSFFNHPSGWCFGNTIVDPANNKPVRGNKIPKEVLVDIENETYYTYEEANPLFSSGGTTAIRTLKHFNGRTFWKLVMSDSKRLRIFFLSDLMVTMIENEGIHAFDIATGKIKWRLARKDSDRDDFMRKPVLTDKYFWLTDGHGIYRIEPIDNNIEVMRYNLEDNGHVRVTDEYFYVITNKQKTLLEIGIDDGVLNNTYQIDDYIPDAKLTTSLYLEHPFRCTTSEEGYKWYVFNPKKPFEPIEAESVKQVRRLNYKWQGWDCYSGKDENTIYGLDTKTGEKTWWIPLDELGENPEVLIADWRGILIGHGNKVSAYGIKE